VPLRHDRFRALRDAKCLSQERLGQLANVAHSTIAKIEGGATPGADTLERLAMALDATTDYFYGRGFEDVDASVAAACMSFDVFAKDPKISNDIRERFRRVLSHPDAPKTARAWHSLAEMLDLFVEPIPTASPAPPKLTLIRERGGQKSKH
jgi:transcriptional regulator with XRE-family HTH domain